MSFLSYKEKKKSVEELEEGFSFTQIKTLDFICDYLNYADREDIEYIALKLRTGIELKHLFSIGMQIDESINYENSEFIIDLLKKTNLATMHLLKDYINNDTLCKKIFEGKEDYEKIEVFKSFIADMKTLYSELCVIDESLAEKEFIKTINSSTQKNNAAKTIVVANVLRWEKGIDSDCNIKLVSLLSQNKYFNIGGKIKLDFGDDIHFLCEQYGGKKIALSLTLLKLLKIVFSKEYNQAIRFKKYFEFQRELKDFLLKNDFYLQFSTSDGKKPCNNCRKVHRAKNKSTCKYCTEIMNLINKEVGIKLSTLLAGFKIKPNKSDEKEKQRQKKYCNKLLQLDYSNPNIKQKIKEYLNYLS